MCVIFGDRDRTEDFCLKFCGASLLNFYFSCFCWWCSFFGWIPSGVTSVGCVWFLEKFEFCTFQQILGFDSISRRCSSPPFPFDVNIFVRSLIRVVDCNPVHCRLLINLHYINYSNYFFYFYLCSSIYFAMNLMSNASGWSPCFVSSWPLRSLR